MNLFVYEGPSTGFINYVKKIVAPVGLDDSEIIHFSAISDEISSRQHNLGLYDAANNPKKERVEKTYLICGKDDYSTITAAGINAFTNLSEQYSFKNIILHNPPKQLVEKVSSRSLITEPVYESYDYKSISKDHILNLKRKLDERVLGQSRAIQNVLASLFMASRERNGNRSPLVVMLYGASGSGKTEMAKIISEIIDGEGNLFRKQLSMHQNSHSANYLFGGEHGEESLARDLMQRESNVILFDEFDKLNQSLYSAFYQLFDEGIFEDSNYSVKTSKAIIICTSNFSSETDMISSLGEPIYSRFDACIEFKPLTYKFMIKIADKIYTECYSELPDSQKNVIKANEDSIKNFVSSVVTEIGNVRIVERYIRQRISSILLEDFLNSQKNPQSNSLAR